MTELRAGRTLAVVAATFALTLTLGGCSALTGMLPTGGGGDAPRDETSGTVQEESDIDIFSLRVGDCKMEDKADAEGVSATKVVPCSESHDEEVYFEFEMPEGEFPGADAVSAAADQGCYDAWFDFVGLDYESSVLNYFPFTPLEQGWNELDDRVIQCVIYDEAGPVTGSLAGVAR